MSVASKRLKDPLAVTMDITMGIAVLASAATVRRQAGARQPLLTMSIKITPYLPRSHQHV
jgi:hypothetical protein